MTMEKNDEEAISPTLADRKIEKTGGFFRLFKKNSRTNGEKWELHLSQIYQGRVS